MNFKSFYIKNISNCSIFIGSVSGGCHINNIEDSNIYVACHQLRIHSTKNTKFYVLINSNPIIEKSNNIIFHPLKISYSLFSKNITDANINVNNNMWNQVQDFQWLKKEKSPNFEYDDNNDIINIE